LTPPPSFAKATEGQTRSGGNFKIILGKLKTPNIGVLANLALLSKLRGNTTYFFEGKMRNMVVPQTGQMPFIAGLVLPPLPSKEVSLASFISLLALHLTQYASIVIELILKIFLYRFDLLALL
jgi:hypothetical protein